MPTARAIRQPPRERADVCLTYVTRRGAWYQVSWKGSLEKSGGVAMNVVPEFASLEWSIRPPPGYDIDRFEAEQNRRITATDPSITVERLMRRPPFQCRDANAFTRDFGLPLETTHLDFWSEAALFSEHGIDAVVIGPGDITQAHAADEFVTLADLDWGVELMKKLFESTHRESI